MPRRFSAWKAGRRVGARAAFVAGIFLLMSIGAVAADSHGTFGGMFHVPFVQASHSDKHGSQDQQSAGQSQSSDANNNEDQNDNSSGDQNSSGQGPHTDKNENGDKDDCGNGDDQTGYQDQCQQGHSHGHGRHGHHEHHGHHGD